MIASLKSMKELRDALTKNRARATKGKACMADDIATNRSFRQEIWRMIWRKIGESYLSVSPIVLMITVLFFTGVVSDFYWPVFVVFLIAAVCIGLGLALFQLGCDQSISKVGGIIGS